MTRKYSEWYPPEIKPVREGVYEVAPFGLDRVRLSWWDGKRWSWFADDMQAALHYVDLDAWHVCSFPWRGLARKPK